MSQPAPGHRSIAKPVEASRRHRADIQAMRALAVTIVIAFHLYPTALRGGFIGVDVFFVISGYLITGLLAADAEQHGRPRLIAFYSKRIRRLLPQSFLVLIVTALATRLLAPQTVWEQWRSEIVASALQVENWHLVRASSDYNAADEGASPVQHFWSLAVEEQFYLLWPILMLIAWLVVRKRSGLVVLLSALSALSLGVCFSWTPEISFHKYFNTTVRLWEFGVGGVLALLSVRVRRGGTLLWFGGLLVLAASTIMVPEANFPNAAALAPVVGAGITLVAGHDLSGPLDRVLAWRPLQKIGDLSYGIYLWHWPLLVLQPYVASGPVWVRSAVVVLGSIALAAIVHPLESRIRRGARRTRATEPSRREAWVIFTELAVATSLVVALPVLALRPATQPNAKTQVTSIDQVKGKPCFGAAALAPGASCTPGSGVVPDPITASRNMPDEQCKAPLGSARVVTCKFGTGSKRVAVVGDSHAQRWLPALKLLAASNGWTITTYLKGSCPYSTVSLRKYASSCGQWNAETAKRIATLHPDLVFTAAASGTDYAGEPGESSVKAGIRGAREAWQPMIRAGAHVVVLRDNPLPGFAGIDPPSCVSAKGPTACAFEKARALKPDAQFEAADGAKGVTRLDLTPYFCEGTSCPCVIGGVMVYRDGQHIIDTYAETLAPMIATALSRARL